MASNSSNLVTFLSEEEKLKKLQAYQEAATKRYEERLAKMEQRKSTKTQHKPEETSNFFWKEFNSQQSAVKSLFEQIPQAQEPSSIIKEVDAKLEILQKYTTDSTLFLNPFDLRTAQATLRSLQTDLTKDRERYVPRKKFGFKSRPKQPQNGIEEPKKELTIPPPALEKPYLPTSSNSFLVKDRKNDNIDLERQEVLHKDILVQNLDNCTLKIHSIPTTVHLSNITNSKVSFGPVKTSIMIHDSVNTVFSMACQQLRIHTSSKCDFYIHVTSRAIIEDCKQLRFAPFTNNYPTFQEDFTQSGLDESSNNWAIVNDFNWLSINEVSPNWCILQEDQRVVW
eukprot:TRINITY_DN1256_c0_g1_i1.p1 TRINITY_DN1256_c0_g1~~TRINITY_DN1256_c0_g1_i1.p1  ORF type:complete len:356 (+),score=56.95 TRINITY_DN1256_c0_g1_i1:54-1070(+)